MWATWQVLWKIYLKVEEVKKGRQPVSERTPVCGSTPESGRHPCFWLWQLPPTHGGGMPHHDWDDGQAEHMQEQQCWHKEWPPWLDECQAHIRNKNGTAAVAVE